MAFKGIDFDKFRGMTPEDRARKRAEQDERLNRQIDEKIATRTAKVVALKSNIDHVPVNHHKFLSDMTYRSETFDEFGKLGGRLADLTERQVEYLDGLFEQFGEKSPLPTPEVK